jgi:hypothetical protein
VEILAWSWGDGHGAAGLSIWLEMHPLLTYHRQMDAIEDNTPPDWVDSLARGKTEIEAGKTVPLEPFLDRLRASIARMKARRQDLGVADGA